MLAGKRQWIYSGLGVPRGVALVRRPSSRSPLTERSTVVLCGGTHASALAVPLGELVRGAGATLVVRVKPGSTPADWAAEPALPAELRALRPAAVLYALCPSDRRSRAALSAAARSTGAAVRWLAPPGDSGRGAETVVAPLYVVSLSGLSVGTYAAWAGAAWRSLAGCPARR